MNAPAQGSRREPRLNTDATGESDPAIIAADIEVTRDEMTETIEAIQERLDPDRLSSQAITTATEVTDQARDAAKEVVRFALDETKTTVNELTTQATTAVRAATVGRVEDMMHQTRHTAEYAKGGMMETIKQHPVPAALAAISIGWLWSHRASSPERSSGYRGHSDAMAAPYSYYDAYGVAGQGYGQSDRGLGQMTGQVQEMAGSAQQQAGQMAGQVQQGVGQVGQQVQERANQMQYQAQGFWQMLESNPVAIGALGVVVGGALGLLIPETEQEHQLMGETRDQLIGSVQQIAGEKIEQAQRVVAEAGQAAMREAQMGDANRAASQSRASASASS